jgi:hypothetical protein
MVLRGNKPVGGRAARTTKVHNKTLTGILNLNKTNPRREIKGS